MDQFAKLTPDYFLPILEESLSVELTSFTHSLPSYINRVYELRDKNENSYIAKFYRPGRWTHGALKDEHEFILDCTEQEIPVVAPITLSDGNTLNSLDGILFALFPRKAGRQFDLEQDENWVRIGSLLGRIHNVGSTKKASHRLTLTPAETTLKYLDDLSQIISKKWKQPYIDICKKTVDTVNPYFEGLETIRIHGDFHVGNILYRLEQGLMVIDFDDMMNGPAVQDFWLVLPALFPASKKYLDLLLSGYNQFRDINPQSELLIEGLRAMRMIYFTAWSAMQRGDFLFKNKFPNWGSESFWCNEVSDLRVQYANIMDSLEPQW